jgi:hypothetical protein
MNTKDKTIDNYIKLFIFIFNDNQDWKNKMDEALDTLSEREKEVVVLRFGLKDGEAKTLEDVGKYFKKTRERIRQIEAKALRKLRHPTRARIINSSSKYFVDYMIGKVKIFVRFLIHQSVRNNLENLHSGKFPHSKTGDFLDVYVNSPYGEISWKELSRISDKEMRELMLKIEKDMCPILENRNIFLKGENFDLVKKAIFGEHGVSWDDPTLDK